MIRLCSRKQALDPRGFLGIEPRIDVGFYAWIFFANIEDRMEYKAPHLLSRGPYKDLFSPERNPSTHRCGIHQFLEHPPPLQLVYLDRSGHVRQSRKGQAPEAPQKNHDLHSDFRLKSC